MPGAARHEHASPPEEWSALLTAQEWRIAVAALGLDRLKELHPMMSEFTPKFRRAFVGHLADLDGCDPARKVLLAVARGAHEALEGADPCPEHWACTDTRGGERRS